VRHDGNTGNGAFGINTDDQFDGALRATDGNLDGMTGGACAGFSTATGAPVSGILFAVEEAHHRISPIILIVAITAVSAARLISELLAPVLGISTNLFPTLQLPVLEWTDIWIPLAIGILFGLFAVAFLSFYRYLSDLLNKKLANVPHQWKILAVLLLTLGMGLLSFSYISTGHELILSLFDGEAILILVVLLVVRTLLTVGANTTHLTGGIFLPILAIGALLSTIFADGMTSTIRDSST
jgi:H+/Cl- antiporter ClcA